MALSTQRLVKTFTGQAGLLGDLRHSTCAGHRTERVRDKRRIAGLQGFLQIGADGLVTVEIISGVEPRRFQSHYQRSNFIANAFAVAMSFACVLLSPPHSSTIKSGPRRMKYTRYPGP